MAKRRISEQRRAAYYVGIVVEVIGFLLFLSVFVTFALNFGNFDNFGARAGADFLRAIIGMVLIVVGAGLRTIGTRGLAGSGVVLDPEKAREDVEPWARMAGGIVKDAVDEAGLNLRQAAEDRGEDDMPFDEKLRRLHKLHSEGILTDEEFEREKQKILDQQ